MFLRGRFFIRRPSGYMSPYPIQMFYGSWRADTYFRAKYPTGKPASTPYVWLFGQYRRVPAWIMHTVFRPFNTYRATQRGERFC
jgi:hypothetical protein